MKNRDRLFWDDQFNAYYMSHGLGRTYHDVLDEFIRTYPEFRAFLDSQTIDDAKTGFVKRQAARFRTADENEHDPAPIPPHIREAFLPFYESVPPLSPTISAFDGQGRLSIEDATPKQHRRHHDGIRRYHRRGVAYREHAVEQWDAMIKWFKDRLPGLQPDNLTMRELLEHLKREAADRNESSDATQDAPSAHP